MASGSAGGRGNRKIKRYTAAKNRRISEGYTAMSRGARRGAGKSAAVPSRWLM